MSRTDMHTPYWVKERDPGWAASFYPIHDHRYGPCDLAQWQADRLYDGYCQMQPVTGFRCGCPICTQRQARRYHHRQARTAWRGEARALRGYARAGVRQHPRREPHRDPHRQGAWGWWGRKQPGKPVTIFTAAGEVYVYTSRP